MLGQKLEYLKVQLTKLEENFDHYNLADTRFLTYFYRPFAILDKQAEIFQLIVNDRILPMQALFVIESLKVFCNPNLSDLREHHESISNFISRVGILKQRFIEKIKLIKGEYNLEALQSIIKIETVLQVEAGQINFFELPTGSSTPSPMKKKI